MSTNAVKRSTRQAMRRCTVVTSIPKSVGAGLQPRRWASYDKTALTKEALVQKVEAGLGDDEYGKALRLDPDAKTISTASGPLPISPIFDPQWMKARRRQRKSSPQQPTGRFRTKLANNAFARALATPIRLCPVTRVLVPRFFLQDFEAVQHPETGKGWLAPGPRAFALVNGPDPITNKQDEHRGVAQAGEEQTEAPTLSDVKEGEGEARRAPVTTYAISRKWLIDEIGSAKRPGGGTASVRSGMAISPGTSGAVMRWDMGDLLLTMMRRSAVDALIRRSTREEKSKYLFVEPCQSWDAVKDVKLRGCVLWLPRQNDAATQYATLDVEGVRYGMKMALHNLNWLLGEEEVARLKDASDIFRDNEIIVLKQWPRPGMMQLHLLLWRLQGYLSTTKSKS